MSKAINSWRSFWLLLFEGGLEGKKLDVGDARSLSRGDSRFLARLASFFMFDVFGVSLWARGFGSDARLTFFMAMGLEDVDSKFFKLRFLIWGVVSEGGDFNASWSKEELWLR
jgi:hypothetical protein